MANEISIVDKSQPSAVDIEQVVLGAILQDKNAIFDVAASLKPEMFHAEENRIVYNAILSLFNKKSPVDILTVTQELIRTKNLDQVGGPGFVPSLSGRVSSSANLDYHIKVIKEKYVRRKLISNSARIYRDSHDESHDIFDLLSKSERILSGVYTDIVEKKVNHISETVEAVSRQREEKKGESSLGILSSIKELDDITGGWSDTDLIILAARPGMGKTGALLTFVANAAKEGKKCLVFSLEMSQEQLVQRMISQESAISVTKIMRNELHESELKRVVASQDRISRWPVYIDDSSSMSVLELIAKSNQIKREHGLDMIFIDYLQLMSGDKKARTNREQEIGYITRSLKGLAKDFKVPVMALSQLSRDVEKRNKAHNRPGLSDLRESGSIEQDSDQVILLYRAEYYDKYAVDEGGNDLRGKAEMIVAKNRNGTTDTAHINYESWTTRFFGDISNALVPNSSFINSEEDFIDLF